MLAAAGLSAYNFNFDTYGTTPSTAPGQTLTASGSVNTKGSWTQIAASTDIVRDCQALLLTLHSAMVSTSQRDMLCDVGVDPAGGTSYTVVAANLVCGETQTILSQALRYLLLLPIKAGSSVALRIQSNIASATCKAVAKFYGAPSNPENVPTAQVCETVGAVTNSQGVAFTPGNAAWGSWQLIGTTARDLWWWQLGVQVSSAAAGSETAWIELAYGDGTTFKTMAKELLQVSSSEIAIHHTHTNLCLFDCYKYLPTGTKIYIRAWASGAPTTGYNALVYGMGG